MNPRDLRPLDPAPQRALIASGSDLLAGVAVMLEAARRTLRVIHRDLAVYELATADATAALARLLLADRSARVRMLVDDPGWLDTRAPRLRQLQRRFPHALELRIASDEDPVGDDAVLIADDHASLNLRAALPPAGDLWVHHRPRAQPLIAAFDRRWESGAHNLPVTPLGL